MKLTKENIKFIDIYLENSDIVYADIRMEIVDHVASDIETKMEDGDHRDFYFVFKDYMEANKSKLIDNSKQFSKSADRKIFGEILKQTFSLVTLVFFFQSIFNFYFINKFFGFETFRFLFLFTPLLVFIGFGLLYLVKTKYYELKRFSAVERLSFPFLAFYLLFIFTYYLTNGAKGELGTLIIIFIGSIAITIFFVLVKTTLQLIREYSQRFKALI